MAIIISSKGIKRLATSGYKQRPLDNERHKVSKRSTRQSHRLHPIKHTLKWLRRSKSGSSPNDGPSQARGSAAPVTGHHVEAGVYLQQENVDLFLDAIPDHIKNIPFGVLMSNNPKLLGLVLGQLRADEDYSQWLKRRSSNLSLLDLGESARRHKKRHGSLPSVLPQRTGNKNPCRRQSLDYELPDTREAKFRPQLVVSPNGIIFRDPFARDVQVPWARGGLVIPPPMDPLCDTKLYGDLW